LVSSRPLSSSVSITINISIGSTKVPECRATDLSMILLSLDSFLQVMRMVKQVVLVITFEGLPQTEVIEAYNPTVDVEGTGPT